MATKSDITNQLHSLRIHGFEAMLAGQATASGFPPSYFFAIASRETNCLNILGDFRGGQYHGVGIVQIDIQHEIARLARDSGSYKTNPGPLVAFGAGILKDNIAQAKSAFPSFTDTQHLKIAASGYNAGIEAAIEGSKHGDSDLPTTGHDYGRDVMSRMAIFDELLAEGT